MTHEQVGFWCNKMKTFDLANAPLLEWQGHRINADLTVDTPEVSTLEAFASEIALSVPTMAFHLPNASFVQIKLWDRFAKIRMDGTVEASGDVPKRLLELLELVSARLATRGLLRPAALTSSGGNNDRR